MQNPRQKNKQDFEVIGDNPRAAPDDAEQEEEDDAGAPLEPEFAAANRYSRMLDKIFSGISPGWQIEIRRTQPGWCKGHLETMNIEEDDPPLSLDYLVDNWGGEVLRIKVKDEGRKYVRSCDIPLLSYPPKRWGKVLPNPNELQTPQAPPPVNLLGNFEQFLTIMDKIKTATATAATGADNSGAMIEMFKLLLKQQAAQQAAQLTPQATNPFSGIDQLFAAVKAVQQLKGILGEADGAAPQQEEPDMFGQVNTLLNTFLQIKKETAKEPSRLTAPQPAAPPQFPTAAPANASPQNINVELSILEAVKNMPPAELADMFLKVVGSLPEEKRVAIFDKVDELLPPDDDDIDNDQK